MFHFSDCGIVHWSVFITAGLLFIYFIAYFVNKNFLIKSCKSKARLDGKIVVITGCNAGLGKETAIDMANRGATVVMACRASAKSDAALKDVLKRCSSTKIVLIPLDLSSMESIRNFAKEFLNRYSQLHILINNAGVMMTPYGKTKDGFETQIGVNHFGHFLLTNLLLKTMVKTGTGRIVNLSSSGHQLGTGTINFDDINWEKTYSDVGAYGQSKLANILFTKELHRKLSDTKITTYTVHPGIVQSDLNRHLKGFWSIVRQLLSPFEKSPLQGAQTSIYCAVQEGLERESGNYFANCGKAESTKQSHDEGVAKKLWEVSEKLTKCSFSI